MINFIEKRTILIAFFACNALLRLIFPVGLAAQGQQLSSEELRQALQTARGNTTNATNSNTANNSDANYRDSLSLQVMRHGKLLMNYVSFLPGNSDVMPDVSDNAFRLSRLNSFFSAALNDSLISFADAEITASSSIDGPYAHNENLARRRALSLQKFLDERYGISAILPVRFSYIPEDWSGLEECVRNADPALFPQQATILHIIQNTPVQDGRETKLRLLDNGVPFQYMKENFFPLQRRAGIVVNYDIKRMMESRVGHKLPSAAVERIVSSLLPAEDAKRFRNDPTIESLPINLPAIEALLDEGKLDDFLENAFSRMDSVTVVVIHDTVTVYQTLPDILPQPTTASRKSSVAFKTNLIYDAALLPNLAMEIGLGSRWSIELEGQICWWNTNGGKRYYDRIETLDVELRKWLGHRHKPNFQGHYIGAYFMGGTYDLKWQETYGYQSDFTFSAGLSYGYSLELSRHFNLEFGLAGGYLDGIYYKYHYDDTRDRWPWKSTRRLRYFGLTKAKIALVYKL